MFLSLVLVSWLWIDSAKSYEADLEGDIMHTLYTVYKGWGDELRNVYYVRTDEDTGWPKHYPSMKVRKVKVEYKSTTRTETKSVTALDQVYQNYQHKNPLKVKLHRSVEVSRTTSTQILRGVRTTLKIDLSLSFPSLGGSGSSVAGKAGGAVSVALDMRERTTITNTIKETFTINQEVTVNPRTSTHVLWVIIEQTMAVTWRATIYLEGYVLAWVKTRNHEWQQRFVDVCALADPNLNDIERVNSTSCRVTVRGFTKVEGGFESRVTTKDQRL
ncbi:uncharacterized protein LOC144161921 [Haemaphysalis longicornis]